ncbi:acyl carrier protein [Chitinimonas arctica]|uniref:Acyl carrier protein n=1 Tax=Chitinimonas arctica TaxID=2594795 RepID=A0A516SCT6_9NEIS|nr:acyl carrier protein [Chitinimonas arctica]QDQ25969.1 acyl carrier protein [Chitinimonas arctica]
MPSLHDFSGKLLGFISRSFLDGDKQLTVETPLMELNILDSVSVFDIVDFISTEYRIRIPLEEIHPANFHSVVRLEELIFRLADGESGK